MKNWSFATDNINEYAEVTARAIVRGAKPVQVVAMVTSSPDAAYVNHKNALAIGCKNGSLYVWTDKIPEDCPTVDIQELRTILS